MTQRSRCRRLAMRSSAGRGRGLVAVMAGLLLTAWVVPSLASHGKTPSLTISPNCSAPAGGGQVAKLSITVEGFDWPVAPPPSTTATTEKFRDPKTRPGVLGEGTGGHGASLMAGPAVPVQQFDFYDISLYFAENLVGFADVDDQGHFRTVITLNRPSAGIYLVKASTYQGEHTATKPFRLPCPSIRLDPACGPVGISPDRYSIRVAGSNFGGQLTPTTTSPPPQIRSLPRLPAALATDGPTPRGATGRTTGVITFAPGPGEERFVIRGDPSGSFVEVVTPLRRAQGTYTVIAEDVDGFRAQASFVVPCPTVTTPPIQPKPQFPPGNEPPSPSPQVPTGPGPTFTPTPTPPPTPTPTAPVTAIISCSPCLGPPGFVASVTGSGFGPGATVTLRWEPGVGTNTVIADSAGAFRTSMLVLPNDRLGPRLLVAEVAGGPRAEASFLVVPSPVKPTGREIHQIRGLTRLVQR